MKLIRFGEYGAEKPGVLRVHTQPGDLGADDAAAEQRYPEHLARFIFVTAHPTSNRSRSSSVSRRTISRAAPSATATTPGRGMWL